MFRSIDTINTDNGTDPNYIQKLKNELVKHLPLDHMHFQVHKIRPFFYILQTNSLIIISALSIH